MTKRITGVFAVLLMAAALALGSTATALAATGNATLTVTGDKNMAGKTINVYQMFSADIDGASTTYTLNAQFDGFFETEIKIADWASLDTNGKSDAAYAYVHENVKTDAEKKAFAEKAAVWAYKNITGTLASNATLTGVAVGTEASATTELPYGYYVVYPKGATNVAARDASVAALVNLGAIAESVNIKSTYPTVEKAADTPTAQIGDKVTYTLTSAVPDMTGYTSYTFAFKDTLSKGLTLDANSIVVKVGDAVLVATTDYTVKAETNVDTSETNLTVTMDMTKRTADAGRAITVTYSATLNEHAIINDGAVTEGNKNSATVEYSNDPSDETSIGVTPPSVVPVYTYEIAFAKVAAGSNTPLAGAVFALSTTADALTVDNVDASQVVVKLAGTASPYKVTATGGSATVTTDASGKIAIQGLKAGTYYLHEITAPSGYNKLAKPVKIVITAGDGGAYTVAVDDGAATNGNIAFDVVNRSGTILPDTGGIGTVALTVGGVLLIVAGAAWMLLRRKRKSGDA